MMGVAPRVDSGRGKSRERSKGSRVLRVLHQHDYRTQKIKGKDTSHRAEHNRKVKSLQAKAMELRLDMKKYPRNRTNEIYEAVNQSP